MQFATKTFRKTLFFLIGRGTNEAFGNCPLTTASMMGRAAIVRFASPNSAARRRIAPEERKKSPIPSGLKIKQRGTEDQISEA
jgi:hypothetical protein